VLVLAQAWAAVTAGQGPTEHVRWRGGLGPLLLVVLVALPVLAVGSVRGIARRCGGCGGTRDPLWRALGWGRAVSQRRLFRFVASRRHAWPAVLGAMAGAQVACTSLRAGVLAFLRATDPGCAAQSTEALVGALRVAACLVSTDAAGAVSASLPPALPLTLRSPSHDTPLPPQWWPVRLRAA
jgi:hypothetical protein